MAKRANRLKSLMGQVAEEVNESPQVSREPDEEIDRVQRIRPRSNQLAELASGKVVEKNLLWVDPATCRLWAYHNRQYGSLDETNCADLIEGLKRQGGQEFPAIVRPVKDDPDFKYEIICGARRHWSITWLRAHNYPRFEFLIEARNLTDEEAFRLSDAENRDRQDISDYERALDYKRAIDAFYEGHQGKMAQRLEVSDGWLSRYLDLARLKPGIVAAYASHTDVKVQHARELKPLLADREKEQRILQAAANLAEEQKQRRAEGRPVIVGPEVLATLKAAVARKRQRTQAQKVLGSYNAASGVPIVQATKPRGTRLVISFLPGVNASEKEYLEACRQAIKDHLA